MTKSGIRIGIWVKWATLIPLGALSLFLSLMGLVGIGFGGGRFMWAYLGSFPVFLLNFWSPRIAALLAWLLLLVAYVPLAILNWPVISPIRLFASRGNGLLILAAVLSTVALLASRNHKTANGSHQAAE